MNNWKDKVVNLQKDSFELGLIWSQGNCLQQIAQEIYSKVKDEDYDYFACIETKGIIFGAAVAAISGKELRIFRKLNKIQYTNDKYIRAFINWKQENDGIEIEKNQIKSGDKFIMIDDIVATAATFNTVYSIAQESNSKIVKFVCIKNLSNKATINGIDIVSLLD